MPATGVTRGAGHHLSAGVCLALAPLILLVLGWVEARYLDRDGSAPDNGRAGRPHSSAGAPSC